MSDPTAASTCGPMLKSGLSCGECLIVASHLNSGPGLNTLLAASRGLGAGRADVCNLLLSGLMVLGVADADSLPEAHKEHEPGSDFLDAYRSPGAPGASEAQDVTNAEKFRAKFKERARELGVGTRCREISGIDWQRRDPLAIPDTYPPEGCIELADGALKDLNEILENERERR